MRTVTIAADGAAELKAKILKRCDVPEKDRRWHCWTWLLRCVGTYPVIEFGKEKNLNVRRVLYLLYLRPGYDPTTHQLRSTCGNPLCVSPYHLEPFYRPPNKRKQGVRLVLQTPARLGNPAGQKAGIIRPRR